MNLQIILTPLAPGIEKPPCGCGMRGRTGSGGKKALDAITAHLKVKMEPLGFLLGFFCALGCVESQSGELIRAVEPIEEEPFVTTESQKVQLNLRI